MIPYSKTRDMGAGGKLKKSRMSRILAKEILRGFLLIPRTLRAVSWGSKFKDAKIEPGRDVLEECCFTIEESLDSVYRKLRKHDKNIEPLDIKVVRRGAFNELMNFFLSRGSSLSLSKFICCLFFLFQGHCFSTSIRCLLR
ncbi:unnamed protein product [Microthlaspi erraticum]|uniref:GH3 C-terminal domain-containing protein n=1 Tax=Microthlaspi erraticum TaxID=1685480 RepID=A0A6D2KA88_9BRAS|nr:unnamed protein product [Microthlaspi erraticum]